jgi:outer membrane lipoprotein-sorting protein
MRGALALAAAVLAASLAHAQAAFTLDALMRELAAKPATVVGFTETRHSTALKTPLVTTGELAFERPSRLERRIAAPIEERYIVDGDRVTIERKGSPPRTLALASQPALAAFLESVRATLRGDLETLRRLYRVELAGDARDWSLVLLPADPELAALIVSIRIAGGAGKLASMEVVEASGDRVVTRFAGAAR